MITLKKTIMAMIAICYCIKTHAGIVTPFSSSEQKRKVFSILKDDREDTRVDYNQDKKIDYWKIKKCDIVIEADYRKSRTYFHIRKFDRSVVKERFVLQQGKVLKLLFSADRKQNIYTYTPSEIACIKQDHISTTSKLEALKMATLNADKCVENSMDKKSCFKDIKNGEFRSFILDAMNNVYRTPSKDPAATNRYLSCLEGPKVKSLFLKRFGSPIGEVEFEKAQMGFKNALLTFTQLQDNDQAPIIYCEQTDQVTPKPPMVTSESSKIKIFVKKPGEKYTVEDLEKQLFHENLHGASVKDEEMVKAISASCEGDQSATVSKLDPADTRSMGVGVTSAYTYTTAKDTGEASNTIAEKSAVVVSNIVETPLPPPTNASPVDMNRVAAVESTERVQSISNSQTSGIVRMAEGVLAATPAVAATGTLAKATSTGSSGSRLPASDYSNTPSISKAKNSAAELITKNKSGVLKPGEYIKEEIDLTKQVGTTSTRSAANAGAKAPTVAAERNAQVAAQTQPADEATEFAGSASGGGSGRSSSAGLSPSSSGGGGARSPQQRGTAAAGSASAQPVYANAREEVVSVLSTNSYRDAQRNLQDKNFQKKLRDSNVKVYDFNGNTYGATKGEVVFVDQGDRFVREK